MQESVKEGAQYSWIGGGGRRLSAEGSAPSFDRPIKEGVGKERECSSTHLSSFAPRLLLVMLKGRGRGQALGSSLESMMLNARVDAWGVEEGCGHTFAGVGYPYRLSTSLRRCAGGAAVALVVAIPVRLSPGRPWLQF